MGNTCARGAGTHGDVLNLHTDVFSACQAAPHTTHTTQHNTQHTTHNTNTTHNTQHTTHNTQHTTHHTHTPSVAILAQVSSIIPFGDFRGPWAVLLWCFAEALFVHSMRARSLCPCEHGWSHAARAPEHQPFDSFASIRWSWTWDLVALFPCPDAPARSAAAVGSLRAFLRGVPVRGRPWLGLWFL